MSYHSMVSDPYTDETRYNDAHQKIISRDARQFELCCDSSRGKTRKMIKTSNKSHKLSMKQKALNALSPSELGLKDACNAFDNRGMSKWERKKAAKKRRKQNV